MSRLFWPESCVSIDYLLKNCPCGQAGTTDVLGWQYAKSFTSGAWGPVRLQSSRLGTKSTWVRRRRWQRRATRSILLA
jgi:hypothetical protein